MEHNGNIKQARDKMHEKFAFDQDSLSQTRSFKAELTDVKILIGVTVVRQYHQCFKKRRSRRDQEFVGMIGSVASEELGKQRDMQIQDNETKSSGFCFNFVERQHKLGRDIKL
ncbi:hypothetical protein RRG08_040362 [Elysia crispata]|uniref:Uncharacterized protein n=1 Tax=Elysia crispata TaxID=231223 RepID=A0AAE1DR01_9GAST|nr:hypothetical protein RRG08_040362 [Elysia crispata]